MSLQSEPEVIPQPPTEKGAKQQQQVQIENTLAEMNILAQEVAAAWTSTKSGVELVDEQRR
jgi:hypothetical protein